MPVPAEVSRENGKRGGRPKSATNKLTRSLANELNRLGMDGLSLMFKNAVFWDSKANEIGALVEEQLERIRNIPTGEHEKLADAIKEFNKTHATYIAVRDKLQSCAVDMAPYTNPRLQAITIKKQTTKTIVTMNLTPAADDTERTYRGDNVVNLPARSAG